MHLSLLQPRKGTPQGPATPKPTRSPRWLQDLRDSRSTNGRAAPARPDPCWIQQQLWPHLNGHQRLSHPGTQEPTRRSARKMLSTRCHPWLGQVCPGFPGTTCPPALPRIEASPRQGAEPTLRGRQSCPGLAAAAATRGPKSQSRKSNGAADTSTTQRCPERPRCRRRRALRKGDFTGCWIMLQPSRAGPTRTKGRPDPQRPPAPSGRARAPAPLLGKTGPSRATTRAPAPTIQAPRPCFFSHPSLIPLRAPARKPGGLFLTGAIPPGKNPLSAPRSRGGLGSERRGGITG